MGNCFELIAKFQDPGTGVRKLACLDVPISLAPQVIGHLLSKLNCLFGSIIAGALEDNFPGFVINKADRLALNHVELIVLKCRFGGWISLV